MFIFAPSNKMNEKYDVCFNLPQRMINIAKLACVISVVSVAFLKLFTERCI